MKDGSDGRTPVFSDTGQSKKEAHGTDQCQGVSAGPTLYKTGKCCRFRTCCLLLLLLLLAALFSALAAFLCYYFMQPGIDHRYVDGKRAQIAVRILNETFLDEYNDPNSTDFQSLAKPFCEAVEGLFQKTDAYRHYNNCQVARISDEFPAWENGSEVNRTECLDECWNGTFVVTFELEFFDMKTEKMKTDIPLLINSHADHKKTTDHDFMYLGSHLISIQKIPPEPEPAFNGVLSNLFLPVYNLTFVPGLKDNTSHIFVERALKFCNDVDFIFKKKPDYHSCKVKEFQEDPVAINVELMFANNDTEMVQSDIMDVIQENAFRVNSDEKKYLVLGELLLTAVNITVPTLPINITDAITTPKPDVTIPPNVIHDGVRVALQFDAHNLDYDDTLQNNQSQSFLDLAKPFCDDLDTIFQDFKDTDERYIGCNVDSFGHNPDEVRSSIIFQGNETKDLRNHIRMAIHKKGIKVIFANRLLTKLGPLMVSPKDWLVWTPINMTTTPLPTTTGLPYYNNLRLDVSYPAYNVSKNPKVMDNTSEIFLKYRREFCKDMDKILKKSLLVSRFLQCDFLEFRDQAKSATFSLIFDDTADDAIIGDITTAIRKYGHFKKFQGKRLAHLGGFLIDVNAGNYEFTFLNYTTTPAPPTTTTEAPTIMNIHFYAYNVSQPDSLVDTTEAKFKEMSNDICQDVLQMVQPSQNLVGSHSTCSLSPFRLQPLSSTMTLTFWGNDKLAYEKQVEKTIWTKALPVAVGSRLFWIGNHILSPDPPERIPMYDGIAIKSKFALYKFSGDASTYKQTLPEFCADLDNLLKERSQHQRYIGCKGTGVSQRPDEISFDLYWNEPNPVGLRNATINSILKFAPNKKTLDGKTVYRVGNVWVQLHRSNMVNHILNTSNILAYFTTTTPAPTTPYIAADAILVNHTWQLYNMTFANLPASFNSSSPEFKYREYRFCHELKSIIHKHNGLKKKDIRCSVLSYGMEPPEIRFVLIFQGRQLPKHELWEAIRWFAPSIGFDKHIRRIGVDNVVVDNEFVDQQLANLTDWKTLAPVTTTTTVAPTTTPNWDLLGDGIGTNLTLRLFNSTLPKELLDPKSITFKREANRFCDHLSEIVSKSAALSDRHLRCLVQGFRDKPSSVNVFLVFDGTDGPGNLTDHVLSAIRSFAPPVRVDGHLTHLIGRTLVWLGNEMESVLIPVNVSDWTTAQPTTTTTLPTTPDWSLLGDGLSTQFSFYLWNFTFDPELIDSKSQTFIKKSQDFCNHMRQIVNQDVLSERFERCSVSNYDKDTSSMRVNFIFHGTDDAADLPQMIEDNIRQYAPKTNATKDDNARQIGHTIIWLNSSLVSLHAANVSDWTTPMPTTTTQMTTPDWSQLGDGLVTNFTFNLWNFTFDPELFDRNSPTFIRKTLDFCNNMRNIIDQDTLNDRFAGCDISQFDKDTSSVRVVLIFHGTDDAADLPQMIEDNIRQYAPKTNATKDDNARQIGHTIIWLNSSLVSLHAANVSDWTTPMPTTTTQMTTPDWSQLGDGLATNFTFNLWNFTFDPELFDRNSPAFIRKTHDFCENMRSIMDQDALHDRFTGCDISNFDKDTSSVKVIFIFHGTDDAADLPQMIEDNIRQYAPKTNATKDDNARQIGHTIIWLNSSLVSLHAANVSDWTTPMPTTTTQMTTPDWSQLGDGLATNFTFNLWNFTFDPELFDRNSPAFIRKTFDFCENMRNIMDQDSLSDRFSGCDISQFDKDTSSMRVVLIFHGTDDAADLPQMIEDNIRQYAPKTNATKDDNARQIGHTIIWLNSSLVSLHAANVSDWTTPMPTTTTQMTTPDWSQLGDGLVTNFTFNLWNFTFDPELFDRNSPAFIRKTLDFCENMRNIMDRDSLSDRFSGCDISQFDKDTSSMRVVLIFRGTDDAADLPQMIEDNIRQYAPKTNATKDDNARQIGHTIIWLNSSLVSLHAANVSDWTTPMPTTTTQMTTPDWSQLGDGLATNFTFNLWNFTFDPELFDRNSPAFIRKKFDFCENMINIMDQDILNDRFAGCDISQFDKDTSSMRVVLIFHGTDDAADLPQMIEDNIRQYAPKTNATKDDNARQIGHTIIWLNSSLVSLHAANVSDWTTPMPTTTTQMTTPDWSQLGDGLATNFTFNLWNFTFDPELFDRNSPTFIRKTFDFCENMRNIMDQDTLNDRFAGCDISQFDKDTSSVKVILIFHGTDDAADLPQMIEDNIRQYAPKTNATKDDNARQIGHTIIWLNSSLVSLHAANVSDWTTPMPTTTTQMTTPDWSQLGDGLATNFTFNLWNFTFDPELFDRNSPAFIRKTFDFCNNMRNIMDQDVLSDRFSGCDISQFDKDTSSMRVVLIFRGTDDAADLPQMIEDNIRQYAPKTNATKDDNARQIGHTIIWLNSSLVSLHAANVSDWTTPMPTTTTQMTTPDWSQLGDGLATNFTFNLWNFTFDPEFFDRNSPAFIRKTLDFCENMRNIMDQDVLSDRFSGCDISQFDKDTSSVKVILIFHGTDDAADLPQMIEDNIRQYAPKTNATKDDNARQIGHTIIWLNSSLVSLHAANVSDWTTPMPTTTTQMTTPDWSQLGDGLATNFTFKLWNFTFDPELFDRSSPAFIRKTLDFCKNMNYIMNSDILSSRYEGCDILHFDKDTSSMKVIFVFHGTDDAADLPQMIEDNIRQYAPKTNATKDDNARQIGHTIIWLNSSLVSLHAANVSDWTTPMPTTTTQMTTPDWSQLGDGLATNFTFNLWNFTFDPELFDRNSPTFIRKTLEFCKNMRNIMEHDVLIDRYAGCDIFNFDKDTSSMRVMLIFQGTDDAADLPQMKEDNFRQYTPIVPYHKDTSSMRVVLIFHGTDDAADLPQMIEDNIRQYAPKTNATKDDNARQIGHTIIWLNSSLVSLHAANVSDWTTPMPTTTTQMTTPDWSELGDGLATNFTFNLWNFTFDPELFDRNSPTFIRKTLEFCKNMKNIMEHDVLIDRYAGCDIFNFDKDTSSMKVIFIFHGTDDAADLPQMIEDNIRQYAHKTNATKDDNARQIGHTIIWLNSSLVSLHAANVSDWTTPMPTTTTQMTTPDWAQLGDGLATNMSFSLYNFSYHPTFADPNSQEFMINSNNFCHNLSLLMENTPEMASRLHRCVVQSYSENPSKVNFVLVFTGTEGADTIPEDVEQLIRIFAPHHPLEKARNLKNIRVVGKMNVLLSNVSQTLLPVNISDWTTLAPPTTTAPDWDLGDSIAANVTFTMYNFTGNPGVLDPDNVDFNINANYFCQELVKATTLGMNSSNVPLECQVSQESSNPQIKVVLVFQKRENPSLIPSEIIDAVRKFSPSDDFGSLNNWVRHLGPSYIWLNDTAIDLFPVNMSDWTRPITTTPEMTTHDWSSERGTVEGHATFLLYNFTLTDGLRDPNSDEYRRKQEEICAEWNEAITHDPNLSGRVAHCSVDQFEEDRVRLMFIFHGSNGTGIEDAFKNLPDPRTTPDGRLKVGGVWVWLKHIDLALGPFTTTPIPETTTPFIYHDAIILNINANLFNLTNASYLFDEDSYKFNWLMNTFCRDLNYITQQNNPPVYLSACKIDKYRFNPDGMNFQIMYPGQQEDVFQPRQLVNLIRNHTKGRGTPDGYVAYPVGQLHLILDTLNFTVRAANRSEEEDNFVTVPLPSTTQPAIYDSILISGSADVYNLTNASSLQNEFSYEFLSHMADFCHELESIAVLYESPIYLSACKISKFRFHPNGVHFQMMYPAQTPGMVGIKEWIDLIRATSRLVFTPEGQSVHQVGRLFLFLDSLNFTVQGTNQSEQDMHFTTPPMPTTQRPVLFDAIILNVTAELFNLTNASYLYQNDSYGYLYQMKRFCSELTSMMEQNQPPIYLSACKIDKFRSSPDGFRFKVMYLGEESDIIKAGQMANLIRKYSEGIITPIGDIAYPVGQLFLILDTLNFTIHKTNQSEEGYYFVTPAMPTTTQPTIFDSILLNVNADLYNLTNTSYLYQEDSYEFLYNMNEFCDELKLIIQQNEPPIYTSACKIEKFRSDPSGMNFKLMYQGSRNDIISAQEMADLIRGQRPGIATPTGNIVYPIGKFFLILDSMTFSIQKANRSEEQENFVTPPMPTTTQPMYFDSIVLNVTAELYNLTNASYLYQKDSYGFLDHMTKFCTELQTILSLNEQPIPLTACKIENFRFTPSGMRFKLMYPGSRDDVITANQMANLIRTSSNGVATSNGDIVYPVGQLLLILDTLNFTIHGVNNSDEQINFVTPPMPTTTQPIFFDSIILNVSAELYNLTNASYLYQKDSYGFLDNMAKFCTDIRNIFTLKELPIDTTACMIQNFRFPPGGMRFKIMYPGQRSDVIAAKEMADLIRSQTSGIATPEGDIVYPVGQQLLILDTLNLTVHWANQSRQEVNFVTLPMPTTTQPTLFDTTHLRVGVGLYNFTWVPALADPESQLFRQRAANFCKTVDGYFKRSPDTTNIFEGCKVYNFSKSPEQINFGLMFKGDQRTNIQEKAVDVLIEYGQHVGGLEAIRIKVGDLTLILDDVHTSVEMANATDFRELTPVKMVFQTKNFTFNLEDFDPKTGSLRNLPQAMCDELLAKFERFQIEPTFTECNFKPLRPNATLRMDLKFDGLNKTIATEFVSQQIEQLSKTMTADGTKGIVLNDVTLLMTEPQTVNIGVRLALFDLDYTEDLKDPESEKFKMLSQSFCKDISRFYMNSYLHRNYRACQILSFTKDPLSGEAVFQFNVAATEGLVPEIVRILNNSAPHVTRNGMQLLQIGDLWVIVGDMGPLGSPRGVSNWQPPQLGSIPLPGEQASTRVWLLRLLKGEPDVTDRSAVLFSFDLLNFTYDARLQNHTSAYFLRHAGTFCQKIDSVFRKSVLANDYATCQVLDFSPDQPYTKVRFQLFLKPTSKLMNISATFGNSLYNSFPKALYNGMEILKVGKYQLIFPGPVQPKQTTDFVLKVVITFNLHNFTYTDSLADQNSDDFKQKQEAFCTDIEEKVETAVKSMMFWGAGSLALADLVTMKRMATIFL